VLGLQGLEFVEQPVVLGVRNTRLVEDVVTVRVWAAVMGVLS